MLRSTIAALGVATRTAAGTAVPANTWADGHSAPVRLAAAASLIMPGTEIGRVLSPADFTAYAVRVIETTAGKPGEPTFVDVPGEFWPATGLGSLTFDQSVVAGQAMLTPDVNGAIERGEPTVIFGHSQSAVPKSRSTGHAGRFESRNNRQDGR